MTLLEELAIVLDDETRLSALGMITLALLVLVVPALVWLYRKFKALDRVERAQAEPDREPTSDDDEVDRILREYGRQWRESGERRWWV